MAVHLPLFPQDKTILPTGKYHVSFSEVNTCSGGDGCGWKHKLKYVDGHTEPDTEHTTYGHALHEALQDWLLQKDSVWFDWTERIELCHEEVQKEFERIKFDPGEETLVSEWLDPIDGILHKVPTWMDAQPEFEGWKTVAAEIQLFEPIEGQVNKWFKGYIDAVIKVPKKARKGSKKAAPPGFIYWILDWKTTSWGWDKRKKQDKYKRMQLALYKHYLSIKLGIPLEDIRCGFVLLKRTAKRGEHCELVEVSVGDKTRQEAVDLVSLSVNLITKRYWLKNRNSCRFCDFKGTPLCP
jgi:hypothetical protein